MVKSNADQLDLLRRNYNGWEEFGVDLTLMFGDIMMAQNYGAQKFGRNIMGVKDGSLSQDQIMFDQFVGYRNFSKKIRDKYKKDKLPKHESEWEGFDEDGNADTKNEFMWDLCKLCQVAAKVQLNEKDHGRPISISYRKALGLEGDEKLSDLIIDGHKKRLAPNPSFNEKEL